eukprot:4270012-Pyramimonas_sp.AAC.1
MQGEAKAAKEVAKDGIHGEVTEELKEQVNEAKGLCPTASDHALSAAVKATSPSAAPEGPMRSPPAQGGQQEPLGQQRGNDLRGSGSFRRELSALRYPRILPRRSQ